MSNQTAIVWGASGGIGKAIGDRLVKEGWTVIGVSRHPDDIVDHLHHAFEGDVSDAYSVETAVHAVAMEVDDIDLFVYAAGDILAAPIEDMRVEQWQRIIDNNLTGVYLSLSKTLPLLTEQCHIIILGAVSERLHLPGLSAYAAAKAGLEAFADTLKKEQRKKTITLIRPGAVKTSLWDKVPMNTPADAMQPEQVAEKVLEAYTENIKGVVDLTH